MGGEAVRAVEAYWPAGDSADQVIIVLGREAADRLVPVLGESWTGPSAVPVGVPDLKSYVLAVAGPTPPDDDGDDSSADG